MRSPYAVPCGHQQGERWLTGPDLAVSRIDVAERPR
jgi:hypothetical protein